MGINYHDKLVKKIERKVKRFYVETLTNVVVDDECEIDLICFVDDHFFDLYEVKSKDTKLQKRSAYWQLQRDVNHLDGYGFVRKSFVYTPKHVYLVKGCDIVCLKTWKCLRELLRKSS